MDSPNSASLQSSSGGGAAATAAAADEDYDSRTNSISSFLNHNPILQPPPPSSSSHHHQTLDDNNNNTTFFHPSSTSYFPPSNSTDPNPVYDPIWSRNIPPDPTFTAFAPTQNDDVYFNSHQQPMYANPDHHHHHHHHHQVGVTTKNPKKRTRASRRAPTTVLTTDTTNFRQMVQEFTGIPTAPFSSSPFTRRLDLFADGGGGGLGPLWRDQNENLANFDGGNRNNPKVDGYKLNSLDFDHQTEKGLENVTSSRNGGDQTQGNVDSWLCPSD
ncbi:hypothetical protein L6452_34619 [Arctium lappa]|uniref:Uncharacterized protein n=1 Tax=Arctium lappa TaxID=4217 RepID=A0ACB8YJE7_ARCLA|nr:hypothetical protein L6452_34619 [Arctium lappa]